MLLWADSNVSYSWTESAEVTLTASRDIACGEELTIDYCDPEETVATRRRRLLEDFGFVCGCPRCTEEGGPAGAVVFAAACYVRRMRAPPDACAAEPAPDAELSAEARRRAAALAILEEKFAPEKPKWRQSATAAGAEFWSFTDGAGKPRITFTRPTASPTEWLAQQEQC